MAFIGIKLNTEVSRLFRNIDVPGKKYAESEYHITVVCFADEWPVKEVSKAMQAAYEVIKDFQPFHIKTKKITCFPKREDKPVPIIAEIESKEIHELNKQLKKSFDKSKVDYKKDFKDFKPHITLSYAEDEIKPIRIEPVEFHAHEVILFGGDEGDSRLFITFPLKGTSASKKIAHLNQSVDIYYKLANKDINAKFVQTTEHRKIAR